MNDVMIVKNNNTTNRLTIAKNRITFKPKNNIIDDSVLQFATIIGNELLGKHPMTLRGEIKVEDGIGKTILYNDSKTFHVTIRREI